MLSPGNSRSGTTTGALKSGGPGLILEEGICSSYHGHYTYLSVYTLSSPKLIFWWQISSNYRQISPARGQLSYLNLVPKKNQAAGVKTSPE
jgi:hypothetical protein